MTTIVSYHMGFSYTSNHEFNFHIDPTNSDESWSGRLVGVNEMTISMLFQMNT